MDKIEKLANLFKIFCDANRLKIIFSLKDTQKSVSQIINDSGLSQPLVSFHLKVLREAKVVKTNRNGTFVFNELAHPELINLIETFSEFAEDKIITEKIFTGPNCKPPWLKGD
ncbi:regulatory protein, ArsR [Alkaliphilus metalliredigens QYMF]|uniref:Regulatory protein, ArsR n=1 Tax=Alkaliphilus metalliredigens (strain QYMF) TaxID=293826 RepID=A6TP89_ALKMQ|nr:metalloregulator ArsR/SmtB family transcription factor [Alkaliphilus metalliredigens]ABR48007.1 regulatory protein, ArsR [Alkaliphilus metalliredigens QYMF]